MYIFGLEQELSNKIFWALGITIGGADHLPGHFHDAETLEQEEKIFASFFAAKKNIYVPGLVMIITIIGLTLWALFANYVSFTLFNTLRHLLFIILIGTIAALVIAVLNVIRELAVYRQQIENPADFTVRRIKTRLQLIQRVVNILIIIAASAAYTHDV